MRLFCAVPIPETLRGEIRRAASPLRASGADVKWAREDGLHLTLAFLGETPPELVPQAAEALSRAAKSTAAFTAMFGRYGAFPDVDEPKVIWLGLAAGTQEMSALAAALRRELLAANLPLDDKPFIAHATLGRVKRPGGLKALKSGLERAPGVKESFRVETAALYESRAVGAAREYVELARAALL